MLGPETYAHAIDSVREVIHYAVPVPVPGSPAEVEGILNVRGEVVSVFSGRRLLSLGEDRDTDDEDRRVIILETSTGLMGLDVDKVKEIVSFSEQDIEATAQVADGELIKGIYHHSEGLLIPIDVSAYCGNISNNTGDSISNNTSSKKNVENG